MSQTLILCTLANCVSMVITTYCTIFLFLEKIFFIYMYVCMCFCVYTYIVWSLGARITGDCELPDISASNWTWVLCMNRKAISPALIHWVIPQLHHEIFLMYILKGPFAFLFHFALIRKKYFLSLIYPLKMQMTYVDFINSMLKILASWVCKSGSWYFCCLSCL